MNGGLSSSFYPQIEKKEEETKTFKAKNLIKFLKLKEDKTNRMGPGYYEYEDNHWLEKKKEDFLNGSHYFKKDNRNRFGENINEKKLTLGPGQYYKNEYFEEKSDKTWPIFLSETKRQPFGNYQNKMGPNENIPFQLPKKKSYHLNLRRNWI